MPNEIDAYASVEDWSWVRIVPSVRECKRPEVYGEFVAVLPPFEITTQEARRRVKASVTPWWRNE